MHLRLIKILILLLVVFNIGLGSFGLAESSEARYAQISKEMVNSGNYLHPTLLGIKHFHKPPLTYYITSIGYKIFGVNEYGARFFLGVTLILQIVLVFKIGLLLFKDEKIAFAGAVIYSSFPIVLIAARNLTTDAYLVSFILLSVFLWLHYKQSNKIYFLYGFYIAMGLIFLTKGPVGLLPPFTFIIFWKLFNKDKYHFSIHVGIGILLMLLVSGSWFIEIIIDDPKVWDYLINDHIINRATNAAQFHRSQPIWYYLLLAPVLGLPWIFFILTIFINKNKAVWRENKNVKPLLFTTLLLFVIFSLFSSKLTLYILPLFPFIALIGGFVIYKFSSKNLNWFINCYHILFVIIIMALIASLFISQIKPNILQTISLIIITAGILIYFWNVKSQNSVHKLLYMGVSFILCLIFIHTSLASNNPNSIHSFKDVAKFIQQEKSEELKGVIIFDDFVPSAKFYLDTRIITVQDDNVRTIRETQFENDTLYKNNHINLQEASELKRFISLFKKEGLVYIESKKSPINDSLSYLLETFPHKIEKAKWVIYY